jgi:hypothetical protein
MGGKREKSVQGNKAYGDISSALKPALGYVTQGGDAISSLLGGDATGFNKYKDATGFDFQAEQGSRGVTNNAAAGGLLRSGSTGKSLVNFGNNLQNQFAESYLGKLLGLAGLGNQSAGVLGDAGVFKKSKSSDKPGLFSMVPGIAASDRRLKTNIEKVGEYADGLGQYVFNYIWGGPAVEGVMSDEVRELRPEALGPKVGIYDTVDYSKL